MNARKTWMLGLAVLGVALAAPAQASPDFDPAAVIVVAKREAERDPRWDDRDPRKDDRRGKRQGAERDDGQGYGYGYERRQQQRHEEDSRQRGRR